MMRFGKRGLNLAANAAVTAATKVSYVHGSQIMWPLSTVPIHVIIIYCRQIFTVCYLSYQGVNNVIKNWNPPEFHLLIIKKTNKKPQWKPMNYHCWSNTFDGGCTVDKCMLSVIFLLPLYSQCRLCDGRFLSRPGNILGPCRVTFLTPSCVDKRR